MSRAGGRSTITSTAGKRSAPSRPPRSRTGRPGSADWPPIVRSRRCDDFGGYDSTPISATAPSQASHEGLEEVPESSAAGEASASALCAQVLGEELHDRVVAADAVLELQDVVPLVLEDEIVDLAAEPSQALDEIV